MRSGSCPQQRLPPCEPSRSMRRAIASPLSIILALILLPPIAFASPPDALWIPGIYDGADGDDVVTLVYETAAASATSLSGVALVACPSEISIESVARVYLDGFSTHAPRAPPVLGFDGVHAEFTNPYSVHTYCSSPLRPPAPRSPRFVCRSWTQLLEETRVDAGAIPIVPPALRCVEMSACHHGH